MNVVKLYDEFLLMSELRDDSVKLIQATTLVTCIKKLVEAHDILDLNLQIMKTFKNYYEDPIIDVCAFKDLNSIRTYLLVFHLGDFKPPSAMHTYSRKIIKLFNILNLDIAGTTPPKA